MGNSSTRSPKVDKITLDNQVKNLRFAVCEMQGWRPSMVFNKLMSGGCNNCSRRI